MLDYLLHDWLVAAIGFPVLLIVLIAALVWDLRHHRQRDPLSPWWPFGPKIYSDSPYYSVFSMNKFAPYVAILVIILAAIGIVIYGVISGPQR